MERITLLQKVLREFLRYDIPFAVGRRACQVGDIAAMIEKLALENIDAEYEVTV